MTIITSEIPDLHIKAVWDKLDKMIPGQFMIIKSVAPNKPEAFINCCKMYIDCFKSAEFNSDYSVIKKIRTFQELTKNGSTFPVKREDLV